MNSRVLKASIGIITFLLIAASAVAVMKPVYKKIDSAISSCESKLILSLEERAGLSISYKSVSPSILSKIYIKGIVASDAKTGDEILRIKKIAVSYSLARILQGNFGSALKKLSARDIFVNVDSSFFSSSVFAKAEDTGAKKSRGASGVSLEKIEDAVKQLAFALPFDVQIRNIMFSFTRNRERYVFSLRDCSIKKDAGGEFLYFKAGGYVSASLKLFGYRTAGFSFGIDGYLLRSVSGSFCRIFLDDYSKAEFSVRRLSFLLNYRNPEIIVRTTKKKYPLSAYAAFDVQKKVLHTAAQMDALDPLQLVKAPSLHTVIRFFRGTVFTTDSEFEMDFTAREYQWKSRTSFSLPERFTKDIQTVRCSASGNSTDIVVEQLAADGGIFKGTFEGTFNIPNLQPSGYMNLEHYAFLNGNKISAEMYFEPRKGKGFDFFVPQLYFGEYSCYTAFQGYASLGMSIELSVEASDYSHPEYGVPGRITASGSLQLGKHMYLQASAELENFFVQTGIKTGAFFTERNGTNVLDKVVEISEPYISSVEAYFATDFKDYTYNSPVALFANTRKDKEVLLVSFDGTDTAVQFSRIDLIYGKNSLVASGGFDVKIPERQMTFFSDFTFNSIPYGFSGTYDFGDWLSVSGDYGIDIAVNVRNFTDGSIRFANLPLSIGGFLLNASLDSSFSIPNRHEWNVMIEHFEISEISRVFRLNPVVQLKGEITEKSFVASEVLYTDSTSSLAGEGYVLWNADGPVLESAHASLSLSSPSSGESVSVRGEISNPLKADFSGGHLANDFYFSAQASVLSFPMARFLAGQKSGNTVSAELSASGTLENPYLSIDITGASVLLGGSDATAAAKASFVEKVLAVSDAEIQWKNFTVSSVSSRIDFGTFDGEAKLKASASAAGRHLDAFVSFSLSNLSDFPQGRIPEAYSIEASVDSVESDFISGFSPFSVSLIRSPGRFDIATDENLGAFGEILDDGTLSFFVSEEKPLHFTANGSVQNQIVSIAFSNIYWDVSKAAPLFNSQFFSVYSGIVEGNAELSGVITDPNINGRLLVSSVDFNMPQFVPDHFLADEVPVELSQEEISIPETNFRIKDGILAVNSLIALDRWSLDSLELNLQTQEDEDIPIDSKISYFRIQGYTSVDASVSVEDGAVTLNGSVGLRNSELSLSLNSTDFVQKKKASSPVDLDFAINLDLLIGRKVQVVINPLLRSLVAPSTPISVVVDTATGLWSIKGDIVLRGGEISYLSRNFYLKQGRLILDETQNRFDPNITVRAETREHDSNGEPVTIRLTAISQNVSNFNAVLSSTPAKSENEIMELLGQIASGDTSSAAGLLAAGVDYGANVTLLRKIESALRDLWNFDIFSVRTAIVQNSIMQGLNMNTRSENDSVIGNLFNNSTVYIGKYFGSDIYADALLHWSYDEAKAGSGETAGSALVFQPEIGLEFEAPFANIRWNFAPDLGEFQQSWTQATSITLSWRISF